MTISDFEGSKKIPFLTHDVEIDLDGEMTLDGLKLSLEEFNKLTGLGVKDNLVLSKIVYSGIKTPPIYWKYFNALKTIENVSTPESITLAIDSPIESLEFPGYFIIPGFSNYVIREDGTLYKRSDGRTITASKGPLGYHTFRMTGDDGSTANELRHRVLCLAFLPYPANVDELDVNHKNGIPGDDWLDNLEWATRSENMMHAYGMGLRSDNKPVQIHDTNTGREYVFPSCSLAATHFKVSTATVINRAKANGYKAYDGHQYRFYPNNDAWPAIAESGGLFLVHFKDGSTKRCGNKEAAFLLGLTRTSLLRALREGRNVGPNGNKVTRINNSLTDQ